MNAIKFPETTWNPAMTTHAQPAASEKIPHMSLSAAVHKTLRQWLSEGELKPGQKMTGRALSERLGVSQTPVREALLQLVAERALVMNPNRSITVPVLDKEKFLELRDMRVALEGLACRHAALNADDALISQIAAVHTHMMQAKRGGDYATTLQLNRQFHFMAYQMSGKEELLAMIESLWARTGPYLNFLYKNVDPASLESHPHDIILEGFRQRDPDKAAHGLAQDIIEGGRAILEALPTA